MVHEVRALRANSSMLHYMCMGTLFMLAIGSLAACQKESGTPQPPERAAQGVQPERKVEKAPRGEIFQVVKKDLQKFTPAIGALRSRQVTKIGPQVSGKVQVIFVDIGDIVNKGQKLVKLDPTFFDIEVAQAKASLDSAKASIDSAEQGILRTKADIKSAKATLDEAGLQLERMRNLWEKPEGEEPSIPKSRYDQALFQYQKAEAGMEAAQARLSESKARLEEAKVKVIELQEALHYKEQRMAETVISAPYDGVVTKRFVDPGEAVTTTPTTHILEVQEVGILELEFSLPQRMLNVVKPGTITKYEIEGVGSEIMEGPVAVVFPAVDKATRTFRCRVKVDNRDGRLLPGMLVKVQVLEEKAADALSVPMGALVKTAEGWSVTVMKNEVADSRLVKVGLRLENEVQILEGVTEGENVLLTANR